VRVTRILHHSVNVQGRLGDASSFYLSVLGLPGEARPDIPGVDGRWFAAGDAQIHLVDAPPGPGPVQPTGPHVCLAVEDLEAAAAELEAMGIDLIRGRQGDVLQIWFVDPAGNTIELQQDRSGS
jgi:catechol 2,3-dioxygenase-like lactoylglutathione lyase family enzyme